MKSDRALTREALEHASSHISVLHDHCEDNIEVLAELLHLLARLAQLFRQLIRDLVKEVVSFQAPHLVIQLLDVNLVRNFRIDTGYKLVHQPLQRVHVTLDFVARLHDGVDFLLQVHHVHLVRFLF